MKKKGGDATFLIALVLGVAIGAAVAIVLSEITREDDFGLEEASDKTRTQGAAEAAR